MRIVAIEIYSLMRAQARAASANSRPSSTCHRSFSQERRPSTSNHHVIACLSTGHAAHLLFRQPAHTDFDIGFMILPQVHCKIQSASGDSAPAVKTCAGPEKEELDFSRGLQQSGQQMASILTSLARSRWSLNLPLEFRSSSSEPAMKFVAKTATMAT